VTVLSPVAVPVPTVSNVAARTVAISRVTRVVVWALAAPALRAGPWLSFTTTSATTSAITTATLPPASSSRLRIAARRSAARRAASRSREVRACARALVRAALPMVPPSTTYVRR
jgi:hypothetical protein